MTSQFRNFTTSPDTCKRRWFHGFIEKNSYGKSCKNAKTKWSQRKGSYFLENSVRILQDFFGWSGLFERLKQVLNFERPKNQELHTY